MTPEELLVEAAKDIDQRGLWKNAYWDPAGLPTEASACAWGALTRAVTGTADYLMVTPWASLRPQASAPAKALIDQAGRLLADYLTRVNLACGADEPTGGPFTRVAKFNDAPATDAERMSRAMREAAS